MKKGKKRRKEWKWRCASLQQQQCVWCAGTRVWTTTDEREWRKESREGSKRARENGERGKSFPLLCCSKDLLLMQWMGEAASQKQRERKREREREKLFNLGKKEWKLLTTFSLLYAIAPSSIFHPLSFRYPQQNVVCPSIKYSLIVLSCASSSRCGSSCGREREKRMAIRNQNIFKERMAHV